MTDWTRYDHIPIDAAASAIEGIVEYTPLAPLISLDPRIELRAKLENRQKTGAFKARGATYQISQLTEAERATGVVACSSGNHGKALAWAAKNAGVTATIVMPEISYPNKIEACRELGANVVLTPTRGGADDVAAEYVKKGWKLVHPYDDERTIAGAGTVGREIAIQWPEVDVVVLPVGGGGLIAGSSLALRRALGSRPAILGAEPAGAASLQRGMAAGEPVLLEEITTEVQGLCPLYSGAHNIDVCRTTLDGVLLLTDEDIYAAQKRLVQQGEVVEPAGAAALALVDSGQLPPVLLEERSESNPLRVVIVVSGGNPDPAQYEALRQES